MVATEAATASTGNGQPDALAPRATNGPPKIDPLGQVVVGRWKKGGEELVKQRRDYWSNLAMFFGEQWNYWDYRRNMLQALPQAWSPMGGRGRARTVTNRIRPNLESLLGRMLRNELEFDVPPTDTADDVIGGAMLAEDVLSAAYRDLDWQQIRFNENFDKFMGGTAAVCVEWDPSAGVVLAVDDETHKVTGTGEVVLNSMSINEFCVQPGNRDASKARWWIQGLAFSPRVVKENFGLDWMPQADAATLTSPLQQKLLEQMGRGTGGDAQLTLVLTMYERPNPQRPKGLYAIVVNGQTVHQGSWPFPDDGLNLFVFHQQRVSSSWIGTTLMNDALPIQVSYNFMRSCIMEHAKKVGNARLMAAVGSLDEDELTDDPGSIMHYTPDMGGTVPQYLRPPDLPRWMVGEAGDLKSELDDVMFVHDTSRGQASFDRASGQALALLAEKDDSPLGLMAFEEAQRWGEIATFALKIYEARVKETRTVQVTPRVSQPGLVRPSKWNGKLLRGQTRVVVPLETTMPYSQAAMQAFARDLWDRQIIKDPATFARMLRVPQRELLSVVDADVARAQRENVRMAQGEAPAPETFDDHAKHIAEHNRFRKGDSYCFAPDKIRSVVDDHIKYHEMLAAEETGAQTHRSLMNPALAAVPQADEPPGSAVPQDYAEQAAGQAMVGAGAAAMQQQQQGQPPGAPMPGGAPQQGGQPPPAPNGAPAPSVAIAAGAPAGP